MLVVGFMYPGNVGSHFLWSYVAICLKFLRTSWHYHGAVSIFDFPAVSSTVEANIKGQDSAIETRRSGNGSDGMSRSSLPSVNELNR